MATCGWCAKQDCILNSNTHNAVPKNMKNITLAVIFSLGAGLVGCASNSMSHETISQPLSAQTPAGTSTNVMTFAHNFQAQGIEVDPDILARGLKDMLSGGNTLLTKEEAGATLNEFQKKLAAKQRQLRETIAATNKIAGEAFLAENKTKPGVITMPDGLQYKVITNGSGATPTMNDTVTVYYRGTLIDGKEFDSSGGPGHSVQFPVNGVIRGWSEALLQMKVGSKWQVFVPSELAYGQQSHPGIPGNSVLVFEVELLSTEHQSPPPPAASTGAPLTSDIIKVPSQEEMKKGAKIEVIKPEDAAKLQQSQPQPSK
jgi:FKBP-type peptidyl-prolyl cis-trans isomerase FklB